MDERKLSLPATIHSVEVFDGVTHVGNASIAADGGWSIPLTDLVRGPHVFSAKTSSGQLVSEPWTINVGQPLDIGAEHNMPIAQYYIVRGRPPVPAPPQAQYQRQATGGVPPYSYSSNNLEVAVVDSESGTVVAAGNGTTLIIVHDSVGQVAEYRIVFFGIQEVQHSEAVSWGQSESDRPWVKTALSLPEMRVFYQTYQEAAPENVAEYLDWPDSSYWTSTNIEGLAWAYAVRLNDRGQEYEERGGTLLPAVLKTWP